VSGGEIETNGSWYKDEASAKAVLKELKTHEVHTPAKRILNGDRGYRFQVNFKMILRRFTLTGINSMANPEEVSDDAKGKRKAKFNEEILHFYNKFFKSLVY